MIKETYINRYLREAHEYEWFRGSYANRCRGTSFFLRAWADMVPQYRDTLCDWGSGDGKVASQFAARNLRVECIDIAKNANRHFDGVVHVGPVWNPPIPGDQKYLLGFCCDVMHYVPVNMVLPTLRVIRNHTIDECWFSIPYNKEPRTIVTDNSLVLSNHNAAWWSAAFAEIFPRFHFANEEDRFIIQAFTERL